MYLVPGKEISCVWHQGRRCGVSDTGKGGVACLVPGKECGVSDTREGGVVCLAPRKGVWCL